MPLHDHFRPPGNRLPWPSLHSGWIGHLAERVNAHLPECYIALDTVRIDGGPEVDVGIEEEDEPARASVESNGGGTAVATTRAVSVPPAATGTVEYELPDVIELRVSSENGGRLVGAVELVSPGNKDRDARSVSIEVHRSPRRRRLRGNRGRHHRPAREFAQRERLGGPDALVLPDRTHIYAATYRPIVRKNEFQVDVWVNPLAVGEPLPTMPLRVIAGPFVPVELEEACVAACRGRKFRV
ncbi:hypothetical protein [Frigoriglobus tundricola]|uniref:DUF4058 family protein n=1 Tax=Frigoriglobus tundricola TaxID=2774151 RepID=A0A6M5YH48_9BACT|nr:hypothetical protein [Frigoriglobus tundricola]QJW93375.1 hypothetical protein FTUN_0881 [Frigoriglobus tundricola]